MIKAAFTNVENVSNVVKEILLNSGILGRQNLDLLSTYDGKCTVCIRTTREEHGRFLNFKAQLSQRENPPMRLAMMLGAGGFRRAQTKSLV